MDSNRIDKTSLAEIGLVVIGRNEGPRLRAGLRSVPAGLGQIVYVDSGSTDDSVAFAESMGVTVVALDMSVGFTAARARNSGFRKICEPASPCRYVQFIDGDCALAPGWVEAAADYLDKNAETVAVWGSRREIAADKSVLNAVCDIEWNQASPGPTKAFGGDVMMRREALEQIGGYRDDVIAAEDDEVSIRLRARGGNIVRLDHPMTFHDAAMTRPAQWWKRARRAGYAYALVSSIHGGAPEFYFRNDVRRTLIWGGLMPALGFFGAFWHWIIPLAVVALYAVRAIRTTQALDSHSWSKAASRAWGASCALSPVPQFAGVCTFLIDRLRQKKPEIIEYK